MSTFSKTFTEEEKIDIRTSYNQAKEPKKQIGILADLYACRKSDIEYVIKDLQPSSAAESNKVTSQKPKHRWTSEEIAEMCLLKAKNTPIKEIATHFGVSIPAIQGQLMKYKQQKADKEASSIPLPPVVNLPYIVESAEHTSTKAKSSAFTLNYFTAIEYLKEFQILASNIALNTTEDVLNFGIALGEFSYKVAEFLKEVDKDGQ